MAMADYYLCDKCGRKAFYDSNVDWDYFHGEMAVLCEACKVTHKVVIVPRESSETVNSPLSESVK